MKMIKTSYLIKVISGEMLIAFIFFSCTKFLDAKPDNSLSTPASLADFQSLLDNNFVMNNGVYGAMAEHAADNYYLNADDWAQIDQDEQKNYIWAENAMFNDWLSAYQVVLYANTILDNIEQVNPGASELNSWRSIKGSALFFRSFALYNIAQEYCKPYRVSTSATDLGLPLRLTAGINEVSVRSTVKQTYDQIIGDLKRSLDLLQDSVLFKTRPTRAAACGALARVYLSMELYDSAGLYADKCLQLDRILIDFNSLDSSSYNPFKTYNEEVIFHSSANITAAVYYGKIDSFLMASYDNDDLRKSCFFIDNGNGTFSFKGSYDGTNGGGYIIFNGITTDETYLIRSECFARAGNTASALKDLNSLLATRWRTGSFVPLTAASQDEVLELILKERRKELIYRGQRWTDIRRLNTDMRFAKILKRFVDGQEYTLPPNDPRYTLLIPVDVIAQSGMQQNQR